MWRGSDIKRTENVVPEITDAAKEFGRGEIEALVEKMGVFFAIPTEIIQKVKKTEVQLIPANEYAQKIVEYLKSINLLNEKEGKEDSKLALVSETFGTTTQNIRDEREKRYQAMIETFKGWGGITLPLGEEGKVTIYLNSSSPIPREILLRHELLHAFGQKDKEGESGFATADGLYHWLNEAVVNLMELAERSQLSPQKLLEALRLGQVETPRPNEVMPLLAVITATYLGEQPFTYPDLAKAYLKGDAYSFAFDVIGRCPVALKENAANLFFKNFFG